MVRFVHDIMKPSPEQCLSGHEYQDCLEGNLQCLEKMSRLFKNNLNFKQILFQPVAELVAKDTELNHIHNVPFLPHLKRCIRVLGEVLKSIAVSRFETWDTGKACYLFTFFDSHRKDKISLFHSIYDNFAKESFLFDHEAVGSLKKRFCFFRTIKKVFLSFYFITLKFNFNHHPLWARLILLNRFLELYELYHVISRQDFSSIKAAIAFTDYAPYDNMIIQHLRQRYHVPSFAFQHAIYHINPREKALLGNITHENFISDYMLCWGRDTMKRLIDVAGIDENRLIEVCNPARNRYIPKIELSRDFNVKKLVLLMSQKRMEPSNFAMLKSVRELCKERDIPYIIKLHPSLSVEVYRSLTKDDKNLTEIVRNEKLVVDLIETNTVFVCHTTTAYYEVLACGVPCFRYSDEALRPFVGLNDKFQETEELMALIDDHPKNIEKWYLEDVEPLINDVFGEFEERPEVKYRNVIQDILTVSS